MLIILILLGVISLLLYTIESRIRSFLLYLDKENTHNDTLYPVFTKYEIGHQLIEVEMAKEGHERQSEEVEKLWKKERREDTKFYPSDHYRWAKKDSIEKRIDYEIALKKYRSLIESNISALNGKKIEDVLNDWDKKVGYTEIVGYRRAEIEKRYKAWEKRFVGKNTKEALEEIEKEYQKEKAGK